MGGRREQQVDFYQQFISAGNIAHFPIYIFFPSLSQFYLKLVCRMYVTGGGTITAKEGSMSLIILHLWSIFFITSNFKYIYSLREIIHTVQTPENKTHYN
jgi:hypothetical protein